jgi:hypothetical protein
MPDSYSEGGWWHLARPEDWCFGINRQKIVTRRGILFSRTFAQKEIRSCVSSFSPP